MCLHAHTNPTSFVSLKATLILKAFMSCVSVIAMPSWPCQTHNDSHAAHGPGQHQGAAGGHPRTQRYPELHCSQPVGNKNCHPEKGLIRMSATSIRALDPGTLKKVHKQQIFIIIRTVPLSVCLMTVAKGISSLVWNQPVSFKTTSFPKRVFPNFGVLQLITPLKHWVCPSDPSGTNADPL